MGRHFNSAKHDIRQLQFMGIEVVQMPRRGGDREKLTTERSFYEWNNRAQVVNPECLQVIQNAYRNPECLQNACRLQKTVRN